MTDPYENLANAIVLQAVKDYRDALKRLKKKPGNQAAMSDAMECERLVQSTDECRRRVSHTKTTRGGEVLMTVKEYLHQAYRLDQRIKSDTMEAQNLREMAGSVSAIQYDKDRVQASRNTEAPFVRTLEKLWTLEKKIAGELEMLSDLKKQIREVIEAVPDTDERMVLKYRYIHNYTWEQIGMELCADARTIRRWHGKALLHVTLPDNPIII